MHRTKKSSSSVNPPSVSAYALVLTAPKRQNCATRASSDPAAGGNGSDRSTMTSPPDSTARSRQQRPNALLVIAVDRQDEQLACPSGAYV